MQKIYSVERIELALDKSNPPLLVVTAYGQTNTADWKNLTLQPLWNATKKPVDGVYEFDLNGDPPGSSNDVLTDVGPVSYTMSFEEELDAKKIIVHASSNGKSVDRSSDVDPGFASKNLVDLGRTATGYSDKWDLAEAFQNAIKNLAADSETNSVDQLYTFTIQSIDAEIGGIGGVNRLRVTIAG